MPTPAQKYEIASNLAAIIRDLEADRKAINERLKEAKQDLSNVLKDDRQTTLEEGAE